MVSSVPEIAWHLMGTQLKKEGGGENAGGYGLVLSASPAVIKSDPRRELCWEASEDGLGI